MSLLRVEGLTKRYGGLVAVKDMAFSIEPGEILGLIGPNGSGKSTCMKLVMGIERPNAGQVWVDGVPVAGQPAHRIARQGVGLVFQHSRPLHRQTVLENVMLALLPDSLLRLAAAGHVRERAAEIATRCGLGAVLHRRPGTLPFADLRRMELAKAIARDPKVVLVDEPFAGLTGGEVADFSSLIAGFRAEGRAVLLVDHNVKGVAALVDRVLAMYLGERVTEGSAAEVMAHPRVREVYLGSGSMTRSLRAAPVAANAEPLLTVEDVSVLYGKAQALERVSLRVGEKECVSVVGLNGAGKTTLFNAISGLVPYSGRISFAGQVLVGQTPGQIARDGIVQCPESRELFGDMSVRENLDLGGSRLPKTERASQLDWLFGLFPILKARQGQRSATLSGGEQQMLAIARALMMKPKLLGEQNVTFALPHADRVYVLEHARISWEGPPERFAQEAGAGLL